MSDIVDGAYDDGLPHEAAMRADLLLYRIGAGKTRIAAQSLLAAMFLAEGDPIDVVDSQSLRFILRRCDELGMTYRVGRAAI